MKPCKSFKKGVLKQRIGLFHYLKLHNAKQANTAWLKEKETSHFALLALCQPFSLIPPLIWKAALATTNRNEQAHCNVSRDGISLTLLAGIM